jgi:hypothetical protein
VESPGRLVPTGCPPFVRVEDCDQFAADHSSGSMVTRTFFGNGFGSSYLST